MTTEMGRLEQDEREAAEERDPELGRVLRLWRTPAVPEGLDDKVLAGFRATTTRHAWWRRFFEISIPVPLPVAVAAMLVVVVSALVLLRQPSLPRESQTRTEAPMTADDSLVTRTSLAGFEPVEDMNVAVVTEGDEP